MPVLAHHTGLCRLAGGLYSWGPVRYQDTISVGLRAALRRRKIAADRELATILGVV